MFFRISLLLHLTVNVLLVVCQDSTPVAQLSNQYQSVLMRCSSLLDHKDANQNVDILPLQTLCYPAMEKYFDCTLANIYKSISILDIQMRSLTDFSKVKSATNKMCSEALKLKEKERQYCNVTAGKCRSSFQPSGKTDKDSYAFCKLAKDKRCTFKEFASCNLQRTMLWAKYQDEARSIGCLMCDPKFQLIPSYGPELKCYSSINIDDVSDTEYAEIYERYCDQFDYNNVSTCIEEALSHVTSEELWEDKETYIKKARKFVDDRHVLCKNLTALSNRKCSITPGELDVSRCRDLFFIPPGPPQFNASFSVSLYAACISLSFRDCKRDVRDVIFRNLISYLT